MTENLKLVVLNEMNGKFERSFLVGFLVRGREKPTTIPN
jgi:hypothetical protein